MKRLGILILCALLFTGCKTFGHKDVEPIEELTKEIALGNLERELEQLLYPDQVVTPLDNLSPEELMELAEETQAQIITYPLKEPPLLTDHFLGISDPGELLGGWAVNRFLVSDILDLLDLSGKQNTVVFDSLPNLISTGDINDGEITPADHAPAATHTFQEITLGDDGVLTPTAGYKSVTILLTCSVDNADIILTEGGSELLYSESTIINASANKCRFAPAVGVLEMAGQKILEQYNAFVIKYIPSTWVPTDDLDSYSVSTVQAGAKIYESAGVISLTAEQMNSFIVMTGAGDVNIPENMCDDLGGGEVSGAWICVESTAIHLNSITSDDGADQLVLSDGTVLAVGNELDLGGAAGNQICVTCNRVNKWKVTGVIGGDTDGGAAD